MPPVLPGQKRGCPQCSLVKRGEHMPPVLPGQKRGCPQCSLVKRGEHVPPVLPGQKRGARAPSAPWSKEGSTCPQCSLVKRGEHVPPVLPGQKRGARAPSAPWSKEGSTCPQCSPGSYAYILGHLSMKFLMHSYTSQAHTRNDCKLYVAGLLLCTTAY